MDIILILFTLGYILQFVAQAFILIHIRKTKSVDGLSLDSQVILTISNLARIFWFTDTSLYEISWVYLELLLSIAIQGYIVFLFRRYKDSQYVQIKSMLNIYSIIPTCLVLGFLFNPGYKYFTFEAFIAFSFYLEAFAMLPQINLMRKIGTVDVKIGKYLVFLAASRFVRILFWIQYYLLGETYLSLLSADVIHTILLADFVWLYFKNQGRGNMIII